MVTGTANYSGTIEFTPVFNGVRVGQYLIIRGMFCPVVPFLMAIVLFVLL